MKQLTILLLLLSAVVLSGCVEKRECEKHITEKYYDSIWTTMRIINKNPVFLAQNWYKERKVCVKYKALPTN